jgi:cbb3-type cytochrome oxidase maturation protein
MEILYLLIPLSVVILLVAIGLFVWAAKSGQFEDLEGPAFRILMDDKDDPMVPRYEPRKGRKDRRGGETRTPGAKSAQGEDGG